MLFRVITKTTQNHRLSTFLSNYSLHTSKIVTNPSGIHWSQQSVLSNIRRATVIGSVGSENATRHLEAVRFRSKSQIWSSGWREWVSWSSLVHTFFSVLTGQVKASMDLFVINKLLNNPLKAFTTLDHVNDEHSLVVLVLFQNVILKLDVATTNPR